MISTSAICMYHPRGAGLACLLPLPPPAQGPGLSSTISLLPACGRRWNMRQNCQKHGNVSVRKLCPRRHDLLAQNRNVAQIRQQRWCSKKAKLWERRRRAGEGKIGLEHVALCRSCWDSPDQIGRVLLLIRTGC